MIEPDEPTEHDLFCFCAECLPYPKDEDESAGEPDAADEGPDESEECDEPHYVELGGEG